MKIPPSLKWVVVFLFDKETGGISPDVLPLILATVRLYEVPVGGAYFPAIVAELEFLPYILPVFLHFWFCVLLRCLFVTLSSRRLSNICTAWEFWPSLPTSYNSIVPFSLEHQSNRSFLSANRRKRELWGVALEGRFSLGSLLDLLLKTREVNHMFITNISLLEQ